MNGERRLFGGCARLRPRRGDAGAATIEFVFLGVLILVPLFYAIIAIFSIQSNVFATTAAAREAGRAFATAPVFTCRWGICSLSALRAALPPPRRSARRTIMATGPRPPWPERVTYGPPQAIPVGLDVG